MNRDAIINALQQSLPNLLAVYAFGSRLTGHATVDVDLRAASTVMQYQIITTGERWWAKDVQAELYEVFILSEKTDLDTRRAALLAEIREEGKVYGR